MLNNSRGFTLLETLIAVAIMMIAFSSILLVESASINNSTKAKQMNIVSMLAKQQMIATEYEIEGKTFEEISKEKEGQFKDPYQDFSWKREIKELEFPKLNLPSASGSGQGEDQSTDMLTRLLSNYLSKAMREITITVRWKKGTGEQRFSVTTYWVNLNHEFQLSE